jgi:hypothetical protein
MSENTTGISNNLPEFEIKLLRKLRLKLLQLHKILLDLERADYEQMFGSVNSGELLQLVINGTQFAWLRMISALVVEIDETLDGLKKEAPATAEQLRGLIAQARLLLTSSDNDVFRQKYQTALQREPDAVIAHAEIVALLKNVDASGERE